MKKLVSVSLVVVLMLLINAVPGFAWRERVYVGPVWSPYPYYARPYYYPPEVVEQPVIIQQRAPDVYIQPAPPPAQQTAEPVYWYYCQDPQGYYPYVKQCLKGWMKVVPTPPALQSAPK